MHTSRRWWRHALLLTLGLILGSCRDGPTAPSVRDLSGTWTGISSYPNAPFTLTLRHDGTRLSGSYRDNLDAGPVVDGVVEFPDFFFRVDFGDTKITFVGTFLDARSAAGEIRTPLLLHDHPFTMTR